MYSRVYDTLTTACHGWRGEEEDVPDDCDFPFVDVGIVNETCGVPWLRFLLDFLHELFR